MKSFLFAMFAISALHAESSKLPQGIYSLENFAEASAKAQETNLPLLFIDGLLDSSCPKVRYMVTGTHDMFRAFKKDAVIVFMAMNQRWQKSPVITPWILGAFSSDGFGNKPPYLVFTSPDQTTVYTIFGDDDVANKDKVKGIKEKVARIHSGEIPPDDFPRTGWVWEPADPKRSGNKGEFVKLIDETTVIARKASGQLVKLDASKWVPHHLEIAKKLSRGEDPTKRAPAPVGAKPVIWRSINGKSIKVTFIALHDEDLTLKRENGKIAKVSLSQLSDESVKLAKSSASQNEPGSGQ